MARPAMPAQGVANPENNDRGENSPAPDQRSQQQNALPGERMIRIGESEYAEADLESAIAERAETASRKATLPASASDYRIELPADFQAPEGVRFEFNKNDPALKAARELAHKRGIDQATFSEMLGVYASTQMGAAIQQSQLRDINMRQLGTAGSRIESVAVWLQARAGAEGKATADFLRKYPSAPIVKTMENLMRAFSNQGGADFSQQHRETVEQNAGKIPGYDNMSFVQRRAVQMRQAFDRGRNDRGER